MAIKTQGYKYVRVFYQIFSKNSAAHEGKLTGNNFIEISWLHEFPGGEFEIESKKVFSQSTTHVTTFTEFPIYGNESRMVVNGALPEDSYVVSCTIYLVK
ncbi:MAG: hypothetical protein HY801_12495 [Candidatus Lindowbacteria bacterium]|nr:hypothetical protein [Candidatus Lindowbacteria bacterium]